MASTNPALSQRSCDSFCCQCRSCCSCCKPTVGCANTCSWIDSSVSHSRRVRLPVASIPSLPLPWPPPCPPSTRPHPASAPPRQICGPHWQQRHLSKPAQRDKRAMAWGTSSLMPHRSAQWLLAGHYTQLGLARKTSHSLSQHPVPTWRPAHKPSWTLMVDSASKNCQAGLVS